MVSLNNQINFFATVPCEQSNCLVMSCTSHIYTIDLWKNKSMKKHLKTHLRINLDLLIDINWKKSRKLQKNFCKIFKPTDNTRSPTRSFPSRSAAPPGVIDDITMVSLLVMPFPPATAKPGDPSASLLMVVEIVSLVDDIEVSDRIEVSRLWLGVTLKQFCKIKWSP